MDPHYVALGDSMSIDLYPRLDLQARGRLRPAAAPGVGAASLFHRNLADLWPAFRDRDLVSREPAMQKLDACVDGATIGHTAKTEIPGIPPDVREAARVVTLTAGGNDLLGGLFDGLSGLAGVARRAVAEYGALAELVARTFPAATLILTTVYDPTDGTGMLPGVSEELGALPMEHLGTFNEAVRSLAADTERAVLADVHHHFLGHGVPAAPDELWYWEVSPIEPGARGASEIRRLWLEALDEAA